MRKLYTDVSLETPFMVSYNDTQTQACANDEDTVTIGVTEFIRLTDEYGHNVSDGEGNQLLLNNGVIYKVVSGVPESTNVQVTDVNPEPTPTQYTLTISPTPADATVVLTATGFTQVWNSITVDAGTTVTYTVSKTGYVTVTDSIVVNGDRSRSVVLEPTVVRHTYTYYLFNGETASFTCSDEGATITSNAVTAAEGATITFSFSKTGYQTLSGTTIMGSSDEYINVDLVMEGYVPAWMSSGSEVGETVYTTYYPPEVGDAIYDGSFELIGTVSGIEATGGIVEGIELNGMTYNRNSGSDMPNPSIAVITVVPHPADATVTLTAQGYTQQGNSIAVDVGTQVFCQVTREGFIGSQQTITANETKAVAVELDFFSITNPPNTTLSYDPNESQDGDYWLYYGVDGSQGQVDVHDMYGANTKYAQIRLNGTPIIMNNTEYYPVIANAGSELYPKQYTLYQPQGYDNPRVLMVMSSLDGLYTWEAGTEYEPERCWDLELVVKTGPMPPEEPPEVQN